MALVHPGKPRAVSFSRDTSVRKELHPAVGLLMGFGILVGVAFAVHFVFHVLF